jgi:hypothetical protein
VSKTRACYNCLRQTYFTRQSDGKPYPKCGAKLNPSLEQDAPSLLERWAGAFEPDNMAAFCDSYLWAPHGYQKLRQIAAMKLVEDPRFTTVCLPEKFVRFYERNETVRIKIEEGISCKWTTCGRVAISTGWQPVFLLMRNRRAHGSSTVLTEDTRLVAVKEGEKGRYKPV